jgi:hypothetical protein
MNIQLCYQWLASALAWETTEPERLERKARMIEDIVSSLSSLAKVKNLKVEGMGITHFAIEFDDNLIVVQATFNGIELESVYGEDTWVDYFKHWLCQPMESKLDTDDIRFDKLAFVDKQIAWEPREEFDV